jgi:uncharacterized protein (TIGR02118 family)
MHKLIALFKTPADVQAFDKHYAEVHLPLVKNVPGLSGLIVSRGTTPPWGGEMPYYLITEMQFPDEATFKAAMSSGENRAVGKDARQFAGNILTLVTAVSAAA